MAQSAKTQPSSSGNTLATIALIAAILGLIGVVIALFVMNNPKTVCNSKDGQSYYYVGQTGLCDTLDKLGLAKVNKITVSLDGNRLTIGDATVVLPTAESVPGPAGPSGTNGAHGATGATGATGPAGPVGGGTLNDAYNFGGPAAGRTINVLAANSPVQIDTTVSNVNPINANFGLTVVGDGGLNNPTSSGVGFAKLTGNFGGGPTDGSATIYSGNINNFAAGAFGFNAFLDYPGNEIYVNGLNNGFGGSYGQLVFGTFGSNLGGGDSQTPTGNGLVLNLASGQSGPAGGDGGSLNVGTGQGFNNGGQMFFNTGNGLNSNGGNLGFSTGSGNNDGGQMFFNTGSGTNNNGGSMGFGMGSGPNNGGGFYVNSGSGTAGDGGQINFNAGSGFNNGGNIGLNAGVATNNNGGSIFGNAGNSTNGFGGGYNFNAGNGPGGGGNFNFNGGNDPSNTNGGGGFNFNAGSGAFGGNFNFNAGQGTVNGGGVNINAGSGSIAGVSNGGGVNIYAATGFSGGSIFVGSGSGDFSGGDNSGSVNFSTGNASNAIGSFNFNAGSSSTTGGGGGYNVNTGNGINGGDINMNTGIANLGAGGNGGNFNFNSGSGESNGGNFSFNSGGGNNGNGGSITYNTGYGVNGNGGSINTYTGGGDINGGDVFYGLGNGVNGNGGSYIVTTGTSTNASGGNLSMITGGGNVNGGNMLLVTGGGTTGGGGALTLATGNGGGADGGTITINTGSGINNGSIIFATGGIERSRFEPGGEFLVNTTVPVLGKVAVFNGDIKVTGVVDPTELQFSGTPPTGGGYRITTLDDNPIYFNTVADRTDAVQIRQADNTTTVFNVDTLNKRVGIGTSAPADTLDIVTPAGLGGITVSNNGGTNLDTAMTSYGADSAVGYFGTATPNFVNAALSNRAFVVGDVGSSGVAIAANDSAGDIAFLTGGGVPPNERMRIDSTGNVGIGTTTPSYHFHVSDTSTDQTAAFTGATQTCIVDTSGAGGWNCTSDERLKTNIMDLSGGLDKILKLQGVTYNFKSNPDGDQIAGFVAQDVQKILPDLVGKDPNGYLNLNKDGMIPYIVEAIKTQNGKIDDVNKQLAEHGLQLTSITDELKALSDQVATHDKQLKEQQTEIDDLKATVEEQSKAIKQLQQGQTQPTTP